MTTVWVEGAADEKSLPPYAHLEYRLEYITDRGVLTFDTYTSINQLINRISSAIFLKHQIVHVTRKLVIESEEEDVKWEIK